jgi:hypothetical protein
MKENDNLNSNPRSDLLCIICAKVKFIKKNYIFNFLLSGFH